MAPNALTAMVALGQAGAGAAGTVAGLREARLQEDLARQATEERRRQGRQLLAAQRVAFAKGGVDLGTGTPTDVLAVTAGEEERAALRAAMPFQSRARAARQAGISAGLSGLGRAFATVAGRSGLLAPPAGVGSSTGGIGSVSGSGTMGSIF